MSNALLRQWEMLKQIPKGNKKISTSDLVEHLTTQGYDVSLRTIQRDLNVLSQEFPGLETDGNKDMAGWSWKQDSELHDFPAINASTAISFKLLQTLMSQMVPPSTLDQLKPYFNRSEDVLAIADQNKAVTWADKVNILPKTMPLIPAKVNEDAATVIYNALLDETQFRGRYLKNDDEVEYVLHPLGLVFRDSVIYLVATAWDYDDPRHYALHRFITCQQLQEKSNRPKGFSLNTYVKKGSFQYGDNGDIKLTAIFNDESGKHLIDTPLSEDQKIVTKKDGSIQITATVKNGLQLRWWLLGFGSLVEVIKPKSLRNEFKEISKNMNALYT